MGRFALITAPSLSIRPERRKDIAGQDAEEKSHDRARSDHEGDNGDEFDRRSHECCGAFWMLAHGRDGSRDKTGRHTPIGLPAVYCLRILSIALPFANSSISLSI